MKQNVSEQLRIVGAITAKDIVDAVKNKNIIGILISALFVIVMYKYLPGLTAEDGPPHLLVYDGGRAETLSALEDNPAVKLHIYDSEEKMKYELTNGERPELGLVIPPDFNPATKEGSGLQIQAYALQIFEHEKVYALKRDMEEVLEIAFGQPVTLSIETIPLQVETYGITVLTSLGFVFAILMVGMLMTPHLMIEEKHNKTIDSLLISPASSTQIILAKILTGLVYSGLMLGLLLVFNRVLIQQVGLFILGGVVGSLFAISVGLLLGLLIDSRQQLTLWAWVVIIPLYLPMMLALMDDLLPKTLIQIFTWWPSSTMFRVFRTAMAGSATAAYYAPQLGVLAAATLVFLFIDAVILRRQTR